MFTSSFQLTDTCFAVLQVLPDEKYCSVFEGSIVGVILTWTVVYKRNPNVPQMGIIIGETAEIGNRCLLYQGVTLGGTGKENGKRHPTICNDVVIGAGAKILGAIEIGANTRIGAGSVVVGNVKADCTVVGIPGRVIHQSGVRVNPLAHSALPDAEANVIRNLMERIDQLENQIEALAKILGTDNIEAASQNIKDREIMEYLGESKEE